MSFSRGAASRGGLVARVALLGAPALAMALPAHASAYYFLDSGTRAIGRGGAFVVGADDLSAQYYNPAALTHITRPQLNFNGWQATQNVDFDRADEDGLDPFPAVHNQADPLREPTGGFAMRLPFLPKATVALGLYLPTSPNMAYPEDGPQRYTLINSLIWQIYAGPSASYDVTKWLTLGAGFQYTFLRVDEKLAAVAALEGTDAAEGSDDPKDDITLDLKTWDKAKFSWNAGFIVRPTPWLEIGGSVQPPIRYACPGSLTATLNPDHFFTGFVDGNSFTDDDVLLHVNVPLIVRGGVQVSPIEKLKTEADFTWTQWSSLSELRIDQLDMHINHNPDQTLMTKDITVTDDVVLPTGYQDSWSVRVGGDYAVTKWAKVRAGAHYESSAVADQKQGVGVVDGRKWGFGAGATFTIKDRVALDVSGAGQFLQSRTISDSTLTQTTLVANLDGDSSVGTGKVIGNGDFASNVVFVAVGATVFFGHGEQPAAAN